MRRNRHRRIGVAFLLFFVCLLGCALARAETSPKKIRVGFPRLRGSMQINEDGSYSGYTVDYLNELRKYVNWEYEFVQVDGDTNAQIGKLMDMLISGEIDMMGTMNYSEALEELFFYPAYSYGVSSTVLVVPANSTRWLQGDYANWDGMRVATYPGLEKRMEQLHKYADACGFSYEEVVLHEGANLYDMVESVKAGETDATLQVDISMSEGMRAILRFNPKPYYFAVSLSRPDILEELNIGLAALQEAYPAIQSELYNRYFSTSNAFYVSQEDQAWISSLDPVRVLFFEGNAPIQFTVDGEPRGVGVSFLKELSAITGMRYEIVMAKDYKEGLRLLHDGAVDLVGAVPGGAQIVHEARLQLSRPYFESRSALIANRGEGELEVQYLSANIEQAMKALRNTPGKGAVVDIYAISYYLRKQDLYKSLSVDWNVGSSVSYAVAFSSDIDERLVNIINAYARSLSQEERQAMLYANSQDTMTYTSGEWLSIHGWKLAVGGVLLAMAIYVYYLYNRNRLLLQQQKEVGRLYKFSQIFEECLFEYSYATDCLVLQNNRVIFNGQHEVRNFLRGLEASSTEESARGENTLREMMRARESDRQFTLRVDGEERVFRVMIGFVEEDYAVGRMADISESAGRWNDLELRATRDALTGALNRAAFARSVEAYLQQARHNGVYLLMDLDNFKNVNDTLGHDVGDQLLQEFASYLMTFFRGGDLKARLGGDEFVVFLYGTIEEQTLSRKLQKLLDGLNQDVFQPYAACRVSVSIGATYVHDGALNVEELYKEADNAMYKAKQGGKNRFVISDGTVCQQETCKRSQDARADG